MTEFKIWHFSYIGKRAADKQDKGLKITADELSNLIKDEKLYFVEADSSSNLTSSHLMELTNEDNRQARLEKQET